MENQYLELIESHNAGDFAVRLDEDLKELVQAVLDTGLKGSLSLNLTVERKKHGQIKFTPKLTPKIPREQPDAGLRYVTPHGQLMEQDPNQPEFAFKTVTPIDAAEDDAEAAGE